MTKGLIAVLCYKLTIGVQKKKLLEKFMAMQAAKRRAWKMYIDAINVLFLFVLTSWSNQGLGDGPIYICSEY